MSRSKLQNMITDAQLDAASVFASGVEYLEHITNNEVELVDTNNAFNYLMEFTATAFANIARKDELLNRLQYPELAMNRNEIYRHMSDTDYLNVFAAPSHSRIMMFFELLEVIDRAVPDGNTGLKKITIPRHTRVMAAGVPFMTLYPIEIRVMPHGGLQIVFDNSRPNPMHPLESNTVDWRIANYNTERREFIQLEVPVVQVDVKHYTSQLSAAKVFSKTYQLSDQYYYARVYSRDGNGNWVEMKTTVSDQVYDPYTPTAVLALLDDNKLNVSLPQVYFNNGSVTRELRIDVFTTRGALEMPIQDYSAEMFSAEFRDYDNDDNGKFTAPVSRLISNYFLASIPATGGSNAITFDKLKQRVIHNALGNIELPVTNVQIQTQLDRLTDAGFSCVTDIDNVTNRLYAASRELPAPNIAEISTGIGTNVITLSRSIDDIISTADVADNGNRVTILPSTLYKDNGGFVSIIDAAGRDAIKSLPGDLLVDAVRSNNYFYTPFHYVYDLSDSVFKVRPYYFGSPAIGSRFFVDDNGSLGVGLSTNSHSFERTESGWKMRVLTNSTDSLKTFEDDAVVAQLAFVPAGELTRVFLNGSFVGRDPVSREWIFEFEFDTTWDVDTNNCIYLTGFEGEGVSPHPYPAKMKTTFDIFFAVDRSFVDVGVDTRIDEHMGKFLVDVDVVAMYHEQITCTLGAALDGLWARARSTIGEEQYLRYEEDVVKIHIVNVIAKDPVTGAVIIERDADNMPHLVYEHRVGDPVTENGQVVYSARRGDIIYQNGAPVVASPRSIIREVDLCLFDGAYYFVNTQTDLEYRDTVPDQVVEWVNVTLKPIRDKLLENTVLWFHPKSTSGLIKALVDESIETTIQAGQHLSVRYYVSNTVLANEVLKDEIRRSTRKTLTNAFKEIQVTRNGLETRLKEVMGSDVLGVRLSNLGGVDNYDVISMADESSRLCIAKKLVALPNDTFGVEDSIDVTFQAHAV